MKTFNTCLSVVVSFFIAVLATHPIIAQTAPTAWSGQITYEGIHKIDPTKLKFLDANGELMKPGDPNWPKDIPDNRMSEQKVLINGTYAKVTRDDEVMRQVTGPGGQSRVMGRPFTERTFIDLRDLKKVTILTVGKDADAKTYQAEAPIQRVSGWQLTDQTRKIAGYTCQKATVPYKNESYTVWITTELPFTYSPIQELTPDTGTVLLIEGSKEQFRAIKVAKTKPDASVAKPSVQAQSVTMDQLAEIRQKAIAEFIEKNGRPGFGG
ncbi:GLPGLI family protein [Spirosoma taeanense]|uniref:GLPGLI family protein n=1 Tax=Spirosoma taeanense TaxID=2735870 RepID=A0A6M5Y3Y3_9BACT|nr:GLPGLI family protein [Spirosoma taeanense]QJW89257.1 GLPGLI family protein [Spirosoma taeanense]